MSYLDAVRINTARLEKAFAEADRETYRYLVECRDMYDAHDHDAGVYCRLVRDAAEVTHLLMTTLSLGPTHDKLLGIYDLRRPFTEQSGIKRAAWLAEHTPG